LRLVNRMLLVTTLMASFCCCVQAQNTKKIIIRILDSKTGHPVQPTGYMIRVDHQTTIHGDWVKQNEDATGDLLIPADASVVSIHASYDNSMEIYINCDSDKPRDVPGEVWYSISDILTSGIVSLDNCVKAKQVAKIKVPDPKPGEIVLFVRPKNWREQAMD
jgi:hypothetical protein